MGYKPAFRQGLLMKQTSKTLLAVVSLKCFTTDGIPSLFTSS